MFSSYRHLKLKLRVLLTGIPLLWPSTVEVKVDVLINARNCLEPP